MLGLEDMHGGAVYVLELSLLPARPDLQPEAPTSAVLLNISPDHLDRHGGMEGYVAAKRRILLNQGKGDTAVIGVDDAWGQQICTEITAANRRTIVPISAGQGDGPRRLCAAGLLYDATGDRAAEVADLTRARSLPGRHNWQNAAAAYAAARAWASRPRTPPSGLMTFPGLAHRMETVAHDRQGALRQRQQGHQRRRRAPGAVQLSQGLLDRRRPGRRPAASTPWPTSSRASPRPI